MFKDYYSILKVNETASIIEIRIAFKKQALIWHPDRNKGMDTTSEMQDINEAYLILKDKEARDRYDQEYERFRRYQKGKNQRPAVQNTSERSSDSAEKIPKNEQEVPQNDGMDTEFIINDDTLNTWINNARRQAAEIVRGSMELAAVGSKVFIKEAFYLILIAIALFFLIIMMNG